MTARTPTPTDSQSYQLAEDAFTSEGGYVVREPGLEARQTDAAADERARLMSELSIHHDGRHYIFAIFRYERLADAVGYAQLMRSRSQPQQEPYQSGYDKVIEPPDGLDRKLMKRLHISFSAGVYEFRGYRYDRLVDAVNYARLVVDSDRRP